MIICRNCGLDVVVELMKQGFSESYCSNCGYRWVISNGRPMSANGNRVFSQKELDKVSRAMAKTFDKLFDQQNMGETTNGK